MCRAEDLTSNADVYRHARDMEFEKALPLFNRLVESDPRQYIGERAKIFAENGESAKALNDLNKAVELDPNLWLGERASFLFSSGAISGAQQDWTTLIQLRTHNLEHLQPDNKQYDQRSSELAQVYLSRGLAFGKNSPQAFVGLKKAADLNINFATDYLDQCEKLKLDSESLKILNRLVEKELEKNLTRRAEFFKNRNQLDLALHDYNEAMIESHRFGMDDGYSPKAWVYLQRALYYRAIGANKLASKDMKSAKNLERLQKIFCGFSAYPVH